ncbi:MAG TPA: hypothetical protein VGA85_05325 [Dehalococcoidales bacterium]
MKLYTYIVARDYGFAPNPFNGYCTLATCKPQIRSRASVGDWVVGTGAKTKYNLAGYLIYAMKVDEVLEFDSYWNDPRFLGKRPLMNGSLKQLYGDNIYYRYNYQWVQADSHHSLDTGQPNSRNTDHDTKVNRLLISRHFVYFGNNPIPIPKRFRPYRPTSEDLCCISRGHRILSHDFAMAFESWLDHRGEWGVQGMPLEFSLHKQIG